MIASKLVKNLRIREATISLEHVLDNSKAESGGSRDLNFLKYLVGNNLLSVFEVTLKRTTVGTSEEYYKEKYIKMSYESDRHFICRSIVQDEIKRYGISTHNGASVGNMDILRANSCYDIVTDDFETIIDIGLTPARNFFRGLTDIKVKNYLITTYFDDYMDDIIFSVFYRANDQDFINAVKDYMEGFNIYIPDDNPLQTVAEGNEVPFKDIGT